MTHARILIADDNPTVRRAIRQLLEENPACTVCGEATDGVAAVEMVRRLRPGIVVLDFQMPSLNGLGAASLIANVAPKTLIILFTGDESRELLNRARDLRIPIVINKQGGGYERLKNCIDDFLKGNGTRSCRDISSRKRPAKNIPSFLVDKVPQPHDQRVRRRFDHLR